MSKELILIAMIALPYLGGLVATCLPKQARNIAATLAMAIASSGVLCAALLYPEIAAGKTTQVEVTWLPSIGLNLIFRLDGLSWLFAILVLGIGALVALYARYYMSPKDPVPRFFSYLLAFMGSMLGVVMSGNLIQIVVFWELTSLFSFLLIGYWHHNQNARDGAWMALTVTGAGGLCLLVGMIMLGHIVGSYELAAVLASGDTVREHPLYLPTLVLILVGAFTKSAQFPFHFWLPQAMAAPTPVSAYLHSATLVKAGVYLLIVLWPIMSGTDAWYVLVGGAGMASLLIGSFAAIFQHDLKGLLAYSTIGHLGLIVLLLGLGSPLAAVAAIFHTLNHATFKASLFMAAGIIDRETGTRDLRRLSGLFRFMPITATLAMVAAAAMAGVPLLNGFLSKEMFLAEALAHDAGTRVNYVFPALATLASCFSVLYALRFIQQTFFGPAPVDLPRQPHEAPSWMRLPIEILVLICLVVGIVPSFTIGPFLDMGVRSVLGDQTPYYSLAIWHGFNTPLLLSTVALVGGAALYVVFARRINTNPHGAPPLFSWLHARQIFERVMNGVTSAARSLLSWLGPSRQQSQLRILIVATIAAACLAASGSAANGTFLKFEVATIDPVFALLWLIAAACALGAAQQAKFHRLVAVVLMSGAGFVSSITFLWLSAPDLALTQLLVEVVTTVLLLLGLRWLPKRSQEVRSPNASGLVRTRFRHGIDLAIAATAGLATAGIAFAVMTTAPPETISGFFLDKSYSDAGGRNVVNVLLVDFRAFDTLGEITVLGIVGLTIFALLRRFRPAADSLATPEQQVRQGEFDNKHDTRTSGETLVDYLMIPRVIMQVLFPVIVVLAIYLFLRGHDLPGGGFIAGVTMAIAFILQYMASGTKWIEARLRILPIRWIGMGLMIAVITGAASVVFGYPFLTSSFQYVDLPIVGRLPLASALIFDLGVFVLVVGATVLMLIALAHQSIRTPRAVEAAPEVANHEADAEPAPEPLSTVPAPKGAI
jgi:multicomponent K+:H+ antiporter subunit A